MCKKCTCLKKENNVMDYRNTFSWTSVFFIICIVYNLAEMKSSTIFLDLKKKVIIIHLYDYLQCINNLQSRRKLLLTMVHIVVNNNSMGQVCGQISSLIKYNC